MNNCPKQSEDKIEEFCCRHPICCVGPTGPRGPMGPTGPSTTISNSTFCFCQAQLSHLIQQLIEKYSGNTFTIYTNTWFEIVGIPSALYQSPDRNGPGLLVVTDENGATATITLNTIVAITVGTGSVYDQSITYLTPTLPFSPGCDTDIITAIHDYWLVSPEIINVYSEILLTSTGNIIKNEYGMLVLQNSDDNHPIFIAPLHITIIEEETDTNK